MFACIYVPDFAVQAAMRNEPGNLDKQPVAILEGPESLRKVVAVNAAARLRGIEIGMSKLQAEVCPGIVLRKRSIPQEETAQAALLDCGCRFSPRVESTSPGIVLVDLSGTKRLLGTFEEIGCNLTASAKNCGLFVRIGIASNPDTALHAARGCGGISVVPSGKEAAFLSPLPIETLQPRAEILDLLDSWGIRSFGSLAALPRISLVERLGQEGLLLQCLAQGEIQRELVLTDAPLSFEETLELEEPLDLLEPLAFILNRLLEQITARLQARALGTDRIRVALELEVSPDRQLEDAGQGTQRKLFHRELKLPLPTQDYKLLLKLLQLDLAAHPPDAPVKKVTVTAEPAELRFTQSGLFMALAPEPGELEIALARLRAVVGENDSAGRPRVGSPVVLDSHSPDGFQVLPFKSIDQNSTSKLLPPVPLALRVFRPPLPARVVTEQQVPVEVVFRGMKARVATAAGPWRGNGDWWNAKTEWGREQWELMLDGEVISGLYRFFREIRSSEWFVEGMYD